jgi:hypothetical protein
VIGSEAVVDPLAGSCRRFEWCQLSASASFVVTVCRRMRQQCEGTTMRKFMIPAVAWLFFGALLADPVLADGVVVGTNIVNPYPLSSEQQDTMLEAMKSAGVRVIRASITLDDKGVDFAERASKLGIKIEMFIFRFGGYEPGGRPLSSADPEQFRESFAPILARLEAKGIALAAFELGNEFNLAGYNSEFPRPSKGMVFGLNDLYHDPEAQQVAKGYRQYLKVLAALKELRDHSSLNQRTPVLTGGLAVYETQDGPLPKGTNTDVVSANATIDYMRANDLDRLVDAYAIHVYPRGNGPGDLAAAAARRDKLAKYVLKECRPAGSADGKPCWLTEWGFNAPDMHCPTNDADRVLLVREMMSNFRPYVRDGRLVGLFSYAWNDVPGTATLSPLTLYRCGALTQSGKLTIDARLVE